MNRILILSGKMFFEVLCALGLIIAFSGCNGKAGYGSQSLRPGESDTGTAILSFEEYEHDFGAVAEGEKVSYSFRFENKGTGDLVIKSVTSTCGCTVPKYDRNPVRPGGNGSIEVVFNTSGREGKQSKTIIITANAKTPETLLRIYAHVIQENNR